ncbi:MAG: RluA family pseudouridine synthase [Clostridia bacterium]|nr:RluA family pseudouridine synthase [Clostridia bacterium]
MKTVVLTVGQGDADKRIDKAATDMLRSEFSRARIQKLIGSGGLLVNGRPVLKGYKTVEGDVISFAPPEPVPTKALPEDIPLDIVYEDNNLLVVNKPRGMVVHPASGNYSGTLVNALLYHCGDSLSGINGVIRPGIVHRIDKDTSGLLIVAKNDMAHISLARQIKEHSFTRMYKTVCHGVFGEPEGTVDAPIGRSSKDRKKMCVTPNNSRNAVTHYRVLSDNGRFSYLNVTLETGRTHQIRVHMAYIGHPVAGDPVYGPKNGVTSLNGQCLHAGLIGFIHPVTGEYMEFRAEVPEYFQSFLDQQHLQE